uniref:Squalene monooxygenase n=1 Tax=Musa acuminata subsp. malaccensis TaxID=214687 RepID=A0A804K305_MUSAM
MEGMYPLGVIAASILAFLLLLGIHGRWGKGRKAAGKRDSGRVAAGFGGADVIVVGAGVTGSALAYALGKDGRRVHVIERDLAEPDRIVGEALQPRGCLNLLELGLEDCVDEIDAQRVLGYVLYKNGRSAKLSIPLEKYHVDVAARCFHHGRFIQRLREKAASLSSVQLKQGAVTSLIKEDGIVKGVVYKTKSGKESKAFAPLTVVCDGCFSNLRHTLCSSKVKINRELEVSFLFHFSLLITAFIHYAFYKLFGTSPDEARKEIGQAYFDCLSLGGRFSSDSTALIGGLNASPLHLVIHFLVAVTHGVGHLLLPIPSVRGLRGSARLISAAAGIVLPLMKAEGFRQTFFPATFPAYYRDPPAQLKQ